MNEKIKEEWRLFVEKGTRKIAGIPLSRVTLRKRVVNGSESFLVVDDALTILQDQIEAIRSKAIVLKDRDIPLVIEDMKERLESIKRDVDLILESFTKPVLKEEEEVSTLMHTTVDE